MSVIASQLTSTSTGQQLVPTNSKQNIKAPQCCRFVMGKYWRPVDFPHKGPVLWIEGVPMTWCHHNNASSLIMQILWCSNIPLNFSSVIRSGHPVCCTTSTAVTYDSMTRYLLIYNLTKTHLVSSWSGMAWQRHVMESVSALLTRCLEILGHGWIRFKKGGPVMRNSDDVVLVSLHKWSEQIVGGYFSRLNTHVMTL